MPAAIRALALTLSFASAAAAAAAAPAAKPADDAPWGEAKDGIACRVIVRPDYCVGELLRMSVEIRNTSDRDRLIPQLFDFSDPRRVRLDIKGPDGAALKLHRQSGYGIPGPGGPAFNLHSFVTIKAGEVKRVEYADIRDVFGPQLNKPGKYSLSYTYFGAKPAAVGGGPVPTEAQLAAAWDGPASAKPAAFEIRPVGRDDLTVHEWGVFTVHNDFKYANADRKAEWESLPKFFYRQFPHLRLTWVPGNWNKPIIYFHSRRECLKIEAKVTFADGAPVVWWPAAAEPVNQGMRPVLDNINTGPAFRSLKWIAWLGKPPATTAPVLVGHEQPVRRGGVLADGAGGAGGAGKPGTQPELPAGSWLLKARDVKEAVNVTVHGTKPAGQGLPPWESGTVETEKFIFYDGLSPVPEGLNCTSSEPAAVTMKNTAKHALRHLFVADRRGGEARFAHVAELAAGASAKIEFAKLDVPAAEKAILASLMQAGLTESEAAALVVVWKPQFLEAQGLTAFYILPQAEYDRMLPLVVTPTPAETVRVGVVLHPRLEGEPALVAQAKELIAKLDDADFNKREGASKALTEMGPSVLKVIREAAATSKSEEVVARCKLILENFDASVYLEKSPKKP